MLSGMRAFAKSPWAIGLFALLILALGLTFNDAFGGMQGGGFVRAGRHEVTAGDVSRDLQRYINQQREETKQTLTPQQAAEQGVQQQIIAQRSQGAMLLAYADRLGVSASAKSASAVIAESPRFKDALGQTSLAEVARFAGDEGFANVQQFEAEFRNSMTQGYLTQSLMSALTPPDILARPLLSYLGEQRTITVARLTAASLPPQADPTAEQLAAFYGENGEIFRLPELRQVTVLSYSADDFLDKAAITDEEVAKEYEVRKRDFSTPEVRTISEYTSPNRNSIQNVVDQVAQGLKLEDAVAMTPGVTLAQRTVQRADLTNEEYAEVVFGLPSAGNFGPVDLSGVFHGVRIDNVTPGVATPLEQVADRIRDDMAREAAGRLFDRTDETFYEMVQDSAKLDAISAEVGAPLITFSGLDAQGRIPAARQTTFLSGVPDLLDSAFRLSAGQTGDVVEFEVDNPYTSDPDDTRPVRAVLRVDAVEAGRQPALEEVRSDVLALYRDEKQREAAGKAVDEVLAAIAGGATLEKAAEGGRMAVVTAPQPFSRADQGALDPAIQEAVFKAAAGAPFRTDDSRGEPWIIRVDAVTPLSPDMEARIGQQLRQQVQQSLSFDVQEMFLKSLQQQIRMRRNEGAIQRFLDSFKPEAE